jgi:hypothetical protein
MLISHRLKSPHTLHLLTSHVKLSVRDVRRTLPLTAQSPLDLPRAE